MLNDTPHQEQGIGNPIGAASRQRLDCPLACSVPLIAIALLKLCFLTASLHLLRLSDLLSGHL